MKVEVTTLKTVARNVNVTLPFFRSKRVERDGENEFSTCSFTMVRAVAGIARSISFVHGWDVSGEEYWVMREVREDALYRPMDERTAAELLGKGGGFGSSAREFAQARESMLAWLKTHGVFEV